MSEASLDLDALTRDQKTKLYEEMRSLDATRRRHLRESELVERERHKLTAMINNTRRRVDRLRVELVERGEELAPAAEAAGAPEPVRTDFETHAEWYNVHDKWFQRKHSAEEFVAARIGRVEHLKRAIAEAEEKLKQLEKRRATLGPGF